MLLNGEKICSSCDENHRCSNLVRRYWIPKIGSTYLYSYFKSLIRWSYQDFWVCFFWEPQEAWGRRGAIFWASGSTITLFDSCLRCRLRRCLRTRASPVGSSRMRIHALLGKFLSHSRWTEYCGGCIAKSAR